MILADLQPSLVRQIFAIVFLTLDGVIYSLLNSIYKIYIALASARLLTNGMFIDISNRIYAVIGVAMLFVMAYVVIQGIVNPDNFAKSGGEGAGLLKRIGIAVVGLALVPGVFRIAYKGQDIILHQNLIGKIFLDYDNEDNEIEHGSITIDGTELEFDSDGDGKPDDGTINQNDAIVTSAGTVTALTLWQAVFHPTNIDSDKDMDKAAEEITATEPNSTFVRGAQTLTKWACGLAVISSIVTFGATLLATAALCGAAVVTDATAALVTKLENKTMPLKAAYGQAAGSGNFMVFSSFAENVGKGEITYRMGVSTIIGLVAAYLFLNFAIDMAIRAVKLAYMQIIAPVPLMLQILPKFKDNFQKWLKTVISLFLEVFLRLTFVYVVVYLISHLTAIMDSGWLKNTDLSTPEVFVAKVILIMGMLLFAKTAPQFVSETLGISAGNMNLGIRKKIADSGVLSIGAAAGGLGANFLSGGMFNAVNHYKNSLKNKTPGGILKALGSGAFGFATGSIGQVGRTARKTIMDAGTVKNFRDMRDRVADSYNRGKEDQIKQEEKKNQRRDDLAAHNFDPENNSVLRNPVKWVMANAGIAGEKMKQGIKDFATIPPDTTRIKGEVEFQAEMEGFKKNVEDYVTENNEGVRQAMRNRAYLDSDRAWDNEALALAKEKGVAYSPEFASANEAEINQRLFAKQQAADAEIKSAKDRAVGEELQKESIKGGGKLTTMMQSFIANHDEDLKKYANSTFDFGDGQSKTLREFMKETFGENYEKGEIDYNAANRGYASQDRDIAIQFTDAEAEGDGPKRARTGVIKYRATTSIRDGKEERVMTAFYYDDDGSEGREVEIEKGIVKLKGSETVIGTNAEMTKGTVIGRQAGLEDGKLKSGTIATMARSLSSGDRISYKVNDGTSTVDETVIVSQDRRGFTEGTIITGAALPQDISVEAIADPTIIPATPDKPIEVQAKLGGTVPVTVKLDNTGTNVQMSLDLNGTEITLDGGIADLATQALSGVVSPQQLALKSSDIDLSIDGSQTISLDSGRQLEVTVAGGAITTCQEVVATGVISAPTVQAAFGASPSIDVVGMVEDMKAGETMAVQGTGTTVYEVGKTAEGEKFFRKITGSGPVVLSQEDAAKDFCDRSKVDEGAIERLAAEHRDGRIKVINGAGERKTVAVASDGQVKVYEDAKPVKNSEIIRALADGSSHTFDLPAGQGQVTATKTASGVEYRVTQPGSTTPSEAMSAEELKAKYRVTVDSSTAVGLIAGSDPKTITIGGETTTIRKVNASELAAHRVGQTLEGEGALEALAKSRHGGSITLESGKVIQVDPIFNPDGTYKDVRYLLVGEDGKAIPKTIDELRAETSLGDTTKIADITFIQEVQDRSESIAKKMEKAGKALGEAAAKRQRALGNDHRERVSSSSDSK